MSSLLEGPLRALSAALNLFNFSCFVSCILFSCTVTLSRVPMHAVAFVQSISLYSDQLIYTSVATSLPKAVDRLAAKVGEQ
jgi:hypothetical protein